MTNFAGRVRFLWLLSLAVIAGCTGGSAGSQPSTLDVQADTATTTTSLDDESLSLLVDYWTYAEREPEFRVLEELPGFRDSEDAYARLGLRTDDAGQALLLETVSFEGDVELLEIDLPAGRVIRSRSLRDAAAGLIGNLYMQDGETLVLHSYRVHDGALEMMEEKRFETTPTLDETVEQIHIEGFPNLLLQTETTEDILFHNCISDGELALDCESPQVVPKPHFVDVFQGPDGPILAVRDDAGTQVNLMTPGVDDTSSLDLTTLLVGSGVAADFIESTSHLSWHSFSDTSALVVAVNETPLENQQLSISMVSSIGSGDPVLELLASAEIPDGDSFTVAEATSLQLNGEIFFGAVVDTLDSSPSVWILQTQDENLDIVPATFLIDPELGTALPSGQINSLQLFQQQIRGASSCGSTFVQELASMHRIRIAEDAAGNHGRGLFSQACGGRTSVSQFATGDWFTPEVIVAVREELFSATNPSNFDPLPFNARVRSEGDILTTGGDSYISWRSDRGPQDVPFSSDISDGVLSWRLVELQANISQQRRGELLHEGAGEPASFSLVSGRGERTFCSLDSTAAALLSSAEGSLTLEWITRGGERSSHEVLELGTFDRSLEDCAVSKDGQTVALLFEDGSRFNLQPSIPSLEVVEVSSFEPTTCRRATSVVTIGDNFMEAIVDSCEGNVGLFAAELDHMEQLDGLDLRTGLGLVEASCGVVVADGSNMARIVDETCFMEGLND